MANILFYWLLGLAAGVISGLIGIVLPLISLKMTFAK
jgi:hypothetical protein